LLYLSSQFTEKDLNFLRKDKKSTLNRSVGPFTCLLGYFDRVEDRDVFITVVADDEKEETILVGFWKFSPEEFGAHTVGPRFLEFVSLIT